MINCKNNYISNFYRFWLFNLHVDDTIFYYIPLVFLYKVYGSLYPSYLYLLGEKCKIMELERKRNVLFSPFIYPSYKIQV